MSTEYKRPDWFTRSVVNRLIGFLTARGMSPRGAWTLAVRGRSSGQWRTVPVNPLPLHGRRYLVAPRGQTEWVRNLRAAGGGELRLGRRAEAFAVRELPDAEKPEVLRAYLGRWRAETGSFFEVGPEATDAEYAAVADRHPVFEVLPADPGATPEPR